MARFYRKKKDTVISTLSQSDIHKLCGWAGAEAAAVAASELPPVSTFKIDNPIRDYRGQRRMLWEYTRKLLGRDTQNYAQQIGDCFIAGTMILMADGTEKPIEEIKIGEMVMNHLNQPRKVTDLVRKKYTGDLITIKAKGWQRTLTATATHNALYLPYTGNHFRLQEFGTKPFGDYNTSDYVLISYGQMDYRSAPTIFDLGAFIGQKGDVEINRVRSRGGEWVNRYLEEDALLGRLIGIYLSKGVCEDDSVSFLFNSKQIDLAEETKNLIKKLFGLNASIIKSNTSVICVKVYSVVFPNFIKKVAPGNDYSKRVPDFFFTSTPETKLSLIRGWLDSGGTKEDVIGIGTSQSIDLSNGIARLANSLKLCPRTMDRKEEEGIKCQFRGKELEKIYPEMKVDKPSRDTGILATPFGYARMIKSITRTEVADYPVYCITVDGEHTLVANGIAQRNCVSFGGKNVLEHLQAIEIVANGEAEKWRPIFPPYFYGTSRVQIGGRRLGNGDGSLGVWLQDAMKKFGVLASDESGVPSYSGSLAKQWGYNGPPSQFLEVGKKNLIRTTALVTTAEDAANAILNGYPIALCSILGFQMTASPDGFHRQSGRWGHCTTIIGFEDHPTHGLYFIILNSWADVHGRLKDFQTGAEIPLGCIRVRAADVGRMLSERDSYAFSQFDGYPDQTAKLDKALFDLVGN